ncbi:MAG TPA: hypothetical protein VK387_02325 [Thermoleophilaceae bacterium]|nr:hypothetical protein [Thermoleophilaceae bacterium]
MLGWVDDGFDSDEARRAAWEEHRDGLLDTRDGGVPGTRPRAFWDYEPGTPDEADFMEPCSSAPGGERVDSDALREAQIRYLAERGELRDDEFQALADGVAAKATWTEKAQEEARRRLDAALEGLARRGDDHRGDSKEEC